MGRSSLTTAPGLDTLVCWARILSDWMFFMHILQLVIDWRLLPSPTHIGLVDMSCEWMNIALRRFLHNHGNITTEISRNRDYTLLLSNDVKCSL